MRAILIDPADRTISEIDYSGEFMDIYTHISAECFDIVSWSKGVDVYVDDEGLLKKNALFKLHNHDQPLAGKGLVLGTNDDGDTIDCPWTLERVSSLVSWTGLVTIATPAEEQFT